MNKALLHIGMFAAVTGMLQCYASGNVKDAAPLVNDPKEVLNIFNSLDSNYQKDFLAENQKDWMPHLFNMLPINVRRDVLDKHKVKLRQEQIREGKGPANVTKLTNTAQRLLGDIEVQRIDQYKVRLSKPLPMLNSPGDYSAIFHYEKDELDNWIDIFGNRDIFSNLYKDMFISYTDDKYPFGRIEFENFLGGIGYISPNIKISEDRMTISWDPVAYYKDLFAQKYCKKQYGPVIKQDRFLIYYKSGIVVDKSTGKVIFEQK